MGHKALLERNLLWRSLRTWIVYYLGISIRTRELSEEDVTFLTLSLLTMALTTWFFPTNEIISRFYRKNPIFHMTPNFLILHVILKEVFKIPSTSALVLEVFLDEFDIPFSFLIPSIRNPTTILNQNIVTNSLSTHCTLGLSPLTCHCKATSTAHESSCMCMHERNLSYVFPKHNDISRWSPTFLAATHISICQCMVGYKALAALAGREDKVRRIND